MVWATLILYVFFLLHKYKKKARLRLFSSCIQHSFTVIIAHMARTIQQQQQQQNNKNKKEPIPVQDLLKALLGRKEEK